MPDSDQPEHLEGASLATLSAELKQHVAGMLDHRSARAVRRTSRDFRDQVDSLTAGEVRRLYNDSLLDRLNDLAPDDADSLHNTLSGERDTALAVQTVQHALLASLPEEQNNQSLHDELRRSGELIHALKRRWSCALAETLREAVAIVPAFKQLKEIYRSDSELSHTCSGRYSHLLARSEALMEVINGCLDQLERHADDHVLRDDLLHAWVAVNNARNIREVLSERS